MTPTRSTQPAPGACAAVGLLALAVIFAVYRRRRQQSRNVSRGAAREDATEKPVTDREDFLSATAKQDNHLTRKQRDRRSKLRRQVTNRMAIVAGSYAPGTPLFQAQLSAKASIAAWAFLRDECGFRSREELSSVDDRAQEDALHAFYDQAYHAGVSADTVATAAEAYLADKFEGRVDVSCRSFWAARDAGFTVRCGGDDGRVRVASIGGGPANDAIGFVVFNSLQERPFANVEVVVHDFCPAWGGIVETIATALSHARDDARREGARQRVLCNATTAPCDHVAQVDVALSFSLADLTAHPQDEVNSRLVTCAPATDVFLFCYVCHESTAWDHEVLPSLLRTATGGALFLFVDLWRKDLDRIEACVTATCPGQYDTAILGSTQAYPFKALACKRRS